MTRRKFYIVLGFAIAALVAKLAIVPTRSHASQEAPEALPTVATVTAEYAPISREIAIESEFHPFQEIDLHAKVAGYVQAIGVDIGDRVKEGDLIATLEVPELEADIERAEAVSRRALQEEKRAEVTYDEAHLSLTRLLGVQKARANLIAQQDIDAAESRDKAAAAALSAAREQTAVAKADHKKLKTMQAYSRITAPFSGVITKRYADKGALIQAGTSSSTQTLPLVRLSQNDRLRILFPVSASIVSQVQTGATVRILAPALKRTIEAKITRLADKIETDTRTMICEVDLPNPDLSIVPGMYGTTLIAVDRKPKALVLPVEAVARGKTSTVMLLKPDGALEERTVELGIETPTRAEILSGLKPGDQVMLGSRTLVHPGEKVNPKPLAQLEHTPSAD